jgi:hypothetical protein
VCSSKSKSAEMVLLTFLLPQSRVGGVEGGGGGRGGQKTHPGHRLDPSHHEGITDDAEYISALCLKRKCIIYIRSYKVFIFFISSLCVH